MRKAIRFLTAWGRPCAKFAPLVSAAILAGCSLADTVHRDTPAQLAAETPYTLSIAYYGGQDPAVKDELTHRGLVPRQDWALIDQHQVAVGMNVIEVLASWGQPDDVRNRTTRSGTHSRYIYNSCKGCYKTYLLFDNDSVLTAIDN